MIFKMVFPWWVSVEQYQKRIYWYNNLRFKIHKMGADGTDASMVTDGDFAHPLLKV